MRWITERMYASSERSEWLFSWQAYIAKALGYYIIPEDKEDRDRSL